VTCEWWVDAGGNTTHTIRSTYFNNGAGGQANSIDAPASLGDAGSRYTYQYNSRGELSEVRTFDGCGTLIAGEDYLYNIQLPNGGGRGDRSVATLHAGVNPPGGDKVDTRTTYDPQGRVNALVRYSDTRRPDVSSALAWSHFRGVARARARWGDRGAARARASRAECEPARFGKVT
jgi:YD repeat-containing protein